MSSVFISNVDDYLAPSQACVNPMFTTEPEKKPDETQKEAAAVVIPTLRRGRRRRHRGITKNAITTPTAVVIPSTPAQVTMADCLACSGCVTTAETVLVEQHSLQTLEQALCEMADTTTLRQAVCFTMSPATWADVARKCGLSSIPLSLKRKITSFLQKTCRANVVLDGRVPLEWSLQEAAREFCHAYSRRHAQETTIPSPSMAVSSSKIQYSSGMVVEKCSSRTESRLAILSSSCPALVCLVEKSTAAAVPHLSTTQSPMTMAGSYLKSKFNSAGGTSCYHVAVMPCHDKKLEASRKDFMTEENGTPLVDLVITTSELWTFLCENAKSQDAHYVLNYIKHFSMAPVSTSIQDVTNADLLSGLLLIVSNGNDEHVEPARNTTDTIENDVLSSNPFFPHGSGGYADYIFKFASKQLFGYDTRGDLPWTPVHQTGTVASGRRVVSARVASVQSKRRDYHQVTLYQHVNGTYSCENTCSSDFPVLRFATAYGLQNIQRVLQSAPFSTTTTTTTTLALPFDYVEAMACPSGCPNGGGQIREANNQRETPTETRERVSKTIQVLQTDCDCCDISETPLNYPHDLCPTGPFGKEAQQVLHTRFHVVPPLQHTMGAAAGVDVKDTQW